MDNTVVKSERLLQIDSKLVNGETLKKKELAQHFHVTKRSIQRDIEALCCFFAEQGLLQDVVYDKCARGYRIENPALQTPENSEILAVCKTCWRAAPCGKMKRFPFWTSCSPAVCRIAEKAVQELMANEIHHYIEPHYQQSLLDRL